MTDWLIPAVFASAVAVAVTVAIERLGGKKGGLLGTLPSTIVPASIGLYAAASTIDDFENAMFITPAGMFVNSLFLFVWRVVPPRLPGWSSMTRLSVTLTLSLAGWAFLASVFVLLGRQIEHNLAPVSLSVIVISAVLGVWACRRNPPAPKQVRTIGPITLASRGILAGAAIGLSVWFGTQGNPLIAGLAAVFPAIYMTTMCALWLSHGEAVGAGAIGPMMLGGTSVSMYAWLAVWTIPSFGFVVGCTISWFTAVLIITVPAWRWLNPKETG